MHEKSDAQLLREYADHGTEPAFREIVGRHTDLVYSVALRCFNSPDLAGDIAQEVFADLARKARPLAEKLAENASLAGWLYRSTRFAALARLRDDHRRMAYERLAMEQPPVHPETEPDWERIRPVLDAVMDDLKDDDREAVVLRYFENSDFRAVGLALGVSEDAAQKRVSRAVERLRGFFAKRGVTIGAGGLVAVVSANAVSAAPVGLVATISTAATLAGAIKAATATTTLTATKAIAMTALQKTAITVALAVAMGTGVYEARQAATLRDQVQTLQQQQEPQVTLKEQIQQLQRERDSATNRLASLTDELAKTKGDNSELLKLRGEVTELRAAQQQSAQSRKAGVDASDPSIQHFMDLKAQADRISKYLDQMPDKKIPELKLLTEEDWLSAAKSAKFDTDADVRKTLSNLRILAKNRLPLGRSLYAFTHANNGQLPGDVSQLKPYFKSALGDAAPDDSTVDAILKRYKLLQTGNVNDLPQGTWVMVEKAPVDRDYDSRAKFGNGTSTTISTGIGASGDPEDISY